MASEFQMPKLGLTMEAGTIMQWLVPDGSEVSLGDAVLLIETDKVETEIECSAAGVLHQSGEVGQSYDCGTCIGWLLGPGEQPPDALPPAVSAASAVPGATAVPGAGVAPTPGAAAVAGAGVAPTPGAATAPGAGGRPGAASGEGGVAVAARGEGGRLLASPNAKRVAAELGVDLTVVSGSGPGGRIVSEDVEAASRRPQPTGTGPNGASPRTARPGRPLATFAARNLADLLGVDLDEVPSLGGDPRLTKDDVAAHVRMLLGSRATGRTAQGVDTAAGQPPLLQTPSRVVPLRGMRGTIAERMHASLRQMAQLSLTMDVDMTTVVEDRARRKATAADDGPPIPGITDYVIAATARALAQHPYANSQVTAEGVAHLPEIHIGLAVALDDGLVVPVIRNTAGLGLDDLAAETTRLAEAGRSGKLQYRDLEGGTFSVTALGMYGVDGFTPVVNPPNTAILGIGRLRDDVRWDGDVPTKTTVVTLSLTWDHRAFDGAPAAELTRTIKDELETSHTD